MPVKVIDVNQGCLDNGMPGEARKCPGALAIKPWIREGIDFTVLSLNVCFSDRRDYLNVDGPTRDSEIIDFPSEVTEKIAAIDQGQTVEPFTFELDIPEWAVKA